MCADSQDPGVVDRLVDWYYALPRRHVEEITTVVLHATEIPDLQGAWEVAMSSAGEGGVGVCGHLYVDRDGTTYRFVSLDRVASHVRNFNSASIGIELVNSGRHPHHFNSGATKNPRGAVPRGPDILTQASPDVPQGNLPQPHPAGSAQ